MDFKSNFNLNLCFLCIFIGIFAFFPRLTVAQDIIQNSSIVGAHSIISANELNSNQTVGSDHHVYANIKTNETLNHENRVNQTQFWRRESTSTIKVRYDVRDVAYFLESHRAHSIADPRAYLTEERTTRSLSIMLRELERFPTGLRFAFVVRMFNEIGRKIASKLNRFSTEVIAILNKGADQLGNKPDVNMIVDAVDRVFESKEDQEFMEETNDFSFNQTPISSVLNSDVGKRTVFNASLKEIGDRLGKLLAIFVVKSRKTNLRVSNENLERFADILIEALKSGCETLFEELSKNDKFRVLDETRTFLAQILREGLSKFRNYVVTDDSNLEAKLDQRFELNSTKSIKDLNPISDKTGLIGPWNSFLFANLGSSERVIKLFSNLLSRVPSEAKSRWINMYSVQVFNELEKTLSGFVTLQNIAPSDQDTQDFILVRSVDQLNQSKIDANFTTNRNKLPARCYLAGRRWRLILKEGFGSYSFMGIVIAGLADKIAKWKLDLVHQNGNEMYRLCLPRLEIGLRGLGINGEPLADDNRSVKFSLKNPIMGLNRMEDPFTCGARFGYNLGVKVGYNEERNASLELESHGGSSYGTSTMKPEERGASVQPIKQIDEGFLAKASYRRAASEAAKLALHIALREGYMTTLRVSIKAGMQIPVEMGSKLSAIKCNKMAREIGSETGRALADNYIIKQTSVSDSDKKRLEKIGETNGAMAGEEVGQSIGAIVGKEAAEEAYKRSIVRGGKLTRSKFYLEQYEAGAKLGFDLGFETGKRVASSASLDASAPKFFRLVKPNFLKGNKNLKSEIDHWEKDLIPPLTKGNLEQLHSKHNHSSFHGNLSGLYKFSKELRQNDGDFERKSYSNLTYHLKMQADGFIVNNVAYLTLNATVNNLGSLYGSVIAYDIFGDKANED